MSAPVQIKDFGYPPSDPRHFGVYEEIEPQTDTAGQNAEFYDDPSEEEEEEDLVRAVSLYAFTPENGNEMALVANQVVYVNCARELGGWLLAYDLETGASGLVPSQYVTISGQETEDTLHECYNEENETLSEQVQGITLTEGDEA